MQCKCSIISTFQTSCTFNIVTVLMKISMQLFLYPIPDTEVHFLELRNYIGCLQGMKFAHQRFWLLQIIQIQFLIHLITYAIMDTILLKSSKLKNQSATLSSPLLKQQGLLQRCFVFSFKSFSSGTRGEVFVPCECNILH